MNYTSPKYVWMFYDWYPRRWWVSVEDERCTDSEIEEFLEKAISLRRYPLVLDTIAVTDAGIVRCRHAYMLHCSSCYGISCQTGYSIAYLFKLTYQKLHD